jgi:hypothetical protein
MNSASATRVLWVRDATLENPQTERRRSLLLAINPRTGCLSAHELGPAGDLLRYATDGKSSGL